MTDLALRPPTNLANGVTVDHEAVLQALNLNPRDPKVQALVMVCQQYGLDPVLKHAVLISGNLYVTRDGLLAVAHRSGDLDGITVEEEGENAEEWWAKVSVHVKGQKYPYTYRGRYPKNGHQKKYGPEMAVKCAEVMALRRAFGVTGIATVEEQWDAHDDAIAADVVEPPNPEDPPADPAKVGIIVDALGDIPDPELRKTVKAQFVQQFGLPANLRQSQWDDVEAWVAAVVAGPGPVVAGDTDGSNDDTGGAIPAESEEASPPEVPPVPSENVGAGGAAVSNGGTDTGHPGGGASDPAPTVDSFVRPPEERIIESAHPATLFHDAVKTAVPMIPDGATDSDLRHAAVSSATDGATEDWRQAHGEALEAATEAVVQVGEGTLVMHRTALGWELRGPRPGEVVAPSPLGELRALIARVQGLGEGRTMLRAKKIAADRGLECPQDFDGLSGELLALVTAEVRAEAEAG